MNTVVCIYASNIYQWISDHKKLAIFSRSSNQSIATFLASFFSYGWMDVTITENKIVKFIVNTGAVKIAKKRKNGLNQIYGKISKVHYLAFEWDVLESRDMGQIQFSKGLLDGWSA